MNKLFRIVLLLTLPYLLILSGCQPGSNNGSQIGPQAAQKITFKFLRASNDEAKWNIWEQRMKEYSDKNPGISFDYAEAPAGNAIETMINVAIASGTAPDLMGLAVSSLANRASKGQLHPLNSYIKKWDEKDDIMDKMYEIGSYNGNIYGIGDYPGANLFVYRKDFFEEAGLDPEKPPKTWEEIAYAAEKTTVRINNEIVRSGFLIEIDLSILTLTLARMNGTDAINEKGEPIFDNPKFVEALAFLTDLYKNKRVSVMRTSKQEEQSALFAEGKAAMCMIRVSSLTSLINDEPSMKEKIGFFMPEKDGKTVSFAGCKFLFLSSESRYKDEAWEFIKFTLSKENNWEIYKRSGRPVVRKSLFDKYKMDDIWLNEAVLKSVEVGMANPAVIYSSELNNQIIPLAMQESFFGKKTPEQALKDAANKLRNDLSRNK